MFFCMTSVNVNMLSFCQLTLSYAYIFLSSSKQRCMPLRTKSILKYCPTCNTQVTGLSLYPMTFDEIDEANKAAESLAKSNKRARKRKNSVTSTDGAVSVDGEKPKGGTKRSFDETKDSSKDLSECRTGRWTQEEIVFCDKLISLFKHGKLPLASGIKLNDFLASMLKSKQSRLTKKMKNARLSSKIFKGTDCFITDTAECSEFSVMEENFLQAVSDPKQRAELRFHMRKEWRETYSDFCLQIGQPLDADAWLSSVEEMDRRVSVARDASRIARRKLMMGYALCQDFASAGPGIFIERSQQEIAAAENNEPLTPNSEDAMFNTAETDEVLALLDGDFNDKTDPNESLGLIGEGFEDFDMIGKSSILHASPFLSKVIGYIKRHNVPFEHVDVWVPNSGTGPDNKSVLGFAGCATSDCEIPSDGKHPANPIDSDDKFNLLAFGDYSQKFSFSEGHGHPGVVFSSGVPIWEEKALVGGFERRGGAMQWGVKSFVCIPLPSPNVGRIVICLYSRHERKRDDSLIKRLQEEFTRLLPTPKWKLVIDMSTVSSNEITVTEKTSFPFISGTNAAHTAAETSDAKEDPRINEIICLLGEELTRNMSSNASGDEFQELTGLRLFLLRSSFSPEEKETVCTLAGSYSSYMGCGRSKAEVATMLSRDFSFLTQAQQPQPKVHYSSGQNRQFAFGSHPENQFGPSVQMNTFSTHYSQHVSAATTTPYSNFSGVGDLGLDTSDPSMSYYPIQDGPGLDTFRSQSPALTPIVPISSQRTNDSLSVVSN